MKPGRVKGVRVDWFTLLFEIPRGEQSSGFRGLIQRCDEAYSRVRVVHSGYKQALRLFNLFRTYPSPTRAGPAKEGFSFPPGPHFRDYLAGAAANNSGARQLLPSRNIAQQRTSNLLPTATIAIFLRDFLPPLIR